MSRIHTSSVGITCSAHRAGARELAEPRAQRLRVRRRSARPAPPARSARARAPASRTRARRRRGSPARSSRRAARRPTSPRAAPTPRACAAARTSAPEAGEQVGVGVDPAIAQERPAAALRLDPREVAVDHAASPRPSHSPGRSRGPAGRRRTTCPRSARRRLRGRPGSAAHTKTPFAIAWPRCTVCHESRMRGVLGVALGVEVADRGRVEEHLGAVEREQARRLGEPLVPADQDADPARPRCRRRGSRGRPARSRTSRRTRGRRGCASCGSARAACRRARTPPRSCGTARARASRRPGTTSATRASAASFCMRSVVGPGIGSASSKSAASSTCGK